MRYTYMSHIETLFKKIWREFIWGMTLDYFTICFIALTRQNYPQKICICSTILSLCQKDKPFYIQKIWTDQPQAKDFFVSKEKVIKSAYSFYRK